jgi:hypothetical protein
VRTSCCAFGPYLLWLLERRLRPLLRLLLALPRERDDDERREREVAVVRRRDELAVRGLRRALVERLRDVLLLERFDDEDRERDDVRFLAVLRDERFVADRPLRERPLELPLLRDDDFLVVGIGLFSLVKLAHTLRAHIDKSECESAQWVVQRRWAQFRMQVHEARLVLHT